MKESDQERDAAAGMPPEEQPPQQQGPHFPRGGERARSGTPIYYYGQSPAGYGGYGYGMPGIGGSATPYGGQHYGGNNEGEGESLFGPLTLARMLRVVMHKWPTLVVAVLLGLGAGFAYFKTAPVSYKTASIVEMQLRRQRIMDTRDVILNPMEGAPDEILNTRLAKLRTPVVIGLVADRLRAEFPELKSVPNDDLLETLYRKVEFTLQRRSRLVEISARHSRPEVAQAIANTYAKTAGIFSIDENKAQSESGVAWLKSTADAQRRMVEKSDDDILKFRVENQIDAMDNQRQAVDLVLRQLNSDLARSEGEQARAIELLNVLTMIQQNPDRLSALPEVVPRASEIAAAQQTLQNRVTERDELLRRYTDKHPDVIQAQNAVDVAEKQYRDAVWRARDTAAANLELIRKQTLSLQEKTKENANNSAGLEQQIVAAQTRLQQLEREREVSDMSYRAILRRMEEARLAYDDSSATITIVREAPLPTTQISPDARIAFTAGPIGGLLLGFFFVMLLDRLEDRITSIADIEQHMSTRVLAAIPRVPRIVRAELATMSAHKKFSLLAESFAGLRSMLESPRYRDLTKVILVVSTQPEEGKTIVSSNLALTYAAAGVKTLLVDMDLRRPRMGRIYKTQNCSETSLLNAFANGDPSIFPKLPFRSGFDNLDIAVSKSDSQLSPANVMGLDIVGQFMEWARANYDRIIIDSPPIGLVSDAVVLGTISDSILLVCRPDHSRYRAVRHAIRQFLESGARVLGVVVNDVDYQRSESFSGYGYHKYNYYYRYGRYGRYGSGYYKRNLADEAFSSDLD